MHALPRAAGHLERAEHRRATPRWSSMDAMTAPMSGIPTTPDTITAQCCIAGGGPAGMMLGFLLARAGVDVVVLEKHGDFLRDFRGDTIHPSTLEVMRELGLLEEFLRLPHRKVERVGGFIGERSFTLADFSKLSGACRYLVFIPQWDFLDFLAARGRRYHGFRVMMNTEATALIERDGAVTGVRARTATGPLTIMAPLTVGCDGRHSTLRAAAGFRVTDLGAPMDVLWMRLSRRPDDSEEVLGSFGAGRIFVMINRGDYWQCAFVIPKGAAEEMKRRDIAELRRDIRELVPFIGDRVNELTSWSDVNLLTVTLDRLPKWYRKGLICIGDAAHAMSPVGGVGINLAIQDAVAAANVLAQPLRDGRVEESHLLRIQVRRKWPTIATQAVQRMIQNRVISRVLARDAAPGVPLPIRLAARFPALQALPAWAIGIGVRPEHVHIPERVPAGGAPGPVAGA
jgi:2-polyprenyl-6-methoxyphenol hydroxylase-like FAD-dependent oxidoreductase